MRSFFIYILIFLGQKRCYKSFKANLTEPSKINQNEVLCRGGFKLNKLKGLNIFT